MTVYSVLLTKLESNHSNLRTNEVEGNTIGLPEVGKHFHMIGESLTPGLSHRAITTTEIQSLEKSDEDNFTFKTLNSTYKLKVLGREEVE